MVVGAVVVVVGVAGLVAGALGLGVPLVPVAGVALDGAVAGLDAEAPDGLTRGAVAARGRVVVAR